MEPEPSDSRQSPSGQIAAHGSSDSLSSGEKVPLHATAKRRNSDAIFEFIGYTLGFRLTRAPHRGGDMTIYRETPAALHTGGEIGAAEPIRLRTG